MAISRGMQNGNPVPVGGVVISVTGNGCDTSDGATGQSNGTASHADEAEVLPFAFYDPESGELCELEIVDGTPDVPLIGEQADRLDEMLSPLWAWMKRREAAVAANWPNTC